MYRFNRVGTLAQSADLQHAIAYSAEITAYVNKTFGIELHHGIELGNQTRIHWSYDFESLADFERVFGQLLMDTAYFEMLQKGKQMWLDGSLQDTIYRKL